MRKIRVDQIKSCISVIADGSGQQFWLAADAVRELVMADRLWRPSEKANVTRGLQALLSGTTESMGLLNVQLPAEFVAAGIVMVVKKVNWQVAASWYESVLRLEDQIEGEDAHATPVTADELFNMCLAVEGDVASFRARFENRMSGLVDGGTVNEG